MRQGCVIAAFCRENAMCDRVTGVRAQASLQPLLAVLLVIDEMLTRFSAGVGVAFFKAWIWSRRIRANVFFRSVLKLAV